jgi:hypothetical protein
MTMNRTTYLAVAVAMTAVLLVPRNASAQLTGVTPGTRVRITAPGYDITNRPGMIVRVSPDSLTIDFSGRTPPVTVPIERLSRVEVSTGRRSGAGLARGAGIGFLVGAAIGSAIVAAREAHHSCDDCAVGYLIVGGGGGVAGAVFGGLIGLAKAPDRWVEVPLRQQSSASRALQPARTTRVGFSIPF